MRAIVQRRYGDDASDVFTLADVPVPTPGDGEVLIHVRAAAVDRGTWHLMVGRPLLARAIGFGLRRPRTPVPGRSVAGVVVAVGPGVVDHAVGDEVFGAGTGGFAEFARARVAHVARKPTTIGFEHAAAMVDSGQTALQAVRDVGKVAAGDRVAVIGASGGVGHLAVQLSKRRGAHVTAVAGTDKLDFVRGLGADAVIDHTLDEITDGPDRFDVVIDIGGNRPLRRLRRILVPTGRLVLVGGEHGGPVLGGIERNLVAHLISPFVAPTLRAFVARTRATDLDVLAAALQAGAVTPHVHRTFGLEKASAAMHLLSDGAVRGKVVLTI
jgi:NADPH:quinone reductase-like Zn-dependent oxidoreductase